jgi:hypothetical protein
MQEDAAVGVPAGDGPSPTGAGGVAWESHHAHFRICVFEGAEATVRSYEFDGEAVGEILERAVGLSGGNAMLWSLALVSDNQARGRGLVWLDGTDYRQQPRTRLEWRARGRMQDRYLFACFKRGEKSPVLPSGLRVLRMFHDYGRDFPLWESFSDQYTLHAGDLPLSEALNEGLAAWTRAWDEEQTFSADRLADQIETGWSLHKQVQLQLRAIAEVRPEFF